MANGNSVQHTKTTNNNNMDEIKLTHSALIAILQFGVKRDAKDIIEFVKLLMEKQKIWPDLSFSSGDIDDFENEYEQSLINKITN